MVAKAKGIDMSKTGSSSGRGSVVPPTARYSTLQDMDAGRHTEIDMFSGALVRMGKELRIPMPYNEYTYHMIKALEEKNDGKFNYTGNQKPIIEITVNENAVIHFELWPEIAPIACGSVMQLAEKKIFDGRAIERLEPGFVLQPLFLMVLIHRSISWSNRNLKPILKMPKSFLNGGLLPWQEIQRTVLAASTISLLLLLRD